MAILDHDISRWETVKKLKRPQLDLLVIVLWTKVKSWMYIFNEVYNMTIKYNLCG